MSQNSQRSRFRKNSGAEGSRRRQHPYRPQSQNKTGTAKERPHNHYWRDYNKFPKFKDNRSGETEKSEGSKNSYDSRGSEQISPWAGGSCSEWESSNLKRNGRSTAPIQRKRKNDELQIAKGESVDSQECQSWDKFEKQPEIMLNTIKRFSSSSADSDVEQLKTHIQNLLEANNERSKNEATAPQSTLNDNNKKYATKKSVPEKNFPSSSSSNNDSSSEDENLKKPKQLKKENASEDEVVCLGAIEQVENLIEKSSDNEDEACILCGKEGHTSFYCFMECKNCGEKYHNLKSCPKPPTISTVMQRLMEFNLRQLRQYNPEAKFDLNSQLPINSEGVQDACSNYFGSITVSPVRSKSSRKRRSSSTDSQCSSSGNTSKKRKHRKSKTNMNSFNPFPFNCGFTPAYPFGTPGMPFGAQGVNMNSLISLAQMMGQFPFNSTNNRI